MVLADFKEARAHLINRFLAFGIPDFEIAAGGRNDKRRVICQNPDATVINGNATMGHFSGISRALGGNYFNCVMRYSHKYL